MTTLSIELPDNIAKQAEEAGLLTPDVLTQLLKDAMRRQAGNRLLEVAKRMQAAGIPPMDEEDLIAEIKAVRAARRARQTKAGNAGRS
jgi:hypothetical protein